MLQAVSDYYFAGYSRAASEAAPIVVVLRKHNNINNSSSGSDVLHLLPSYPQHVLVTPQPASSNTPQRQTHNETIVTATADITEDIEIQYVSSSQASEWDWSEDEDDEQVGEKDKKNGEDERKAEDYPGHGTLLELRGVEPTSATESAAVPHAQQPRSDAHFLIPATTPMSEGSNANVDAEGLPPHTMLTVLGYEEAGQHAAYVLATLPPHASSSSSTSAAQTSTHVMVYRCADPAVLHCMCDRVEKEEEDRRVSTMQRLPVQTSEVSASKDTTRTMEERPADVLYSPPLDPTLLPTVFGLSAAPMRYRLNHTPHTLPHRAAAASDNDVVVVVQFVGVACGVPWVCVLTAAGPQGCEPLPLCYDEASLTRLYAPQPLTSTTSSTSTSTQKSTATTIRAADTTTTTTTAESKARPALPVTTVGAHRVKVAGPYGVPLQCDTRLSDRFTLHHGDRLRANTHQSSDLTSRREKDRLATVIGLCGGCLVVLYDGDTRATLLPSEVNSDATLAQHFTLLPEEEDVREREQHDDEEEVRNDEEKEDVTKKDVVHAAREDAHDAAPPLTTNNATNHNTAPAAPFTTFLTAYGLHMSRHAVHSIEPNTTQPPWQVAQAYFMTDTAARMSAALQVYHKVQAAMRVRQSDRLTQEDYGRLIAECIGV